MRLLFVTLIFILPVVGVAEASGTVEVEGDFRHRLPLNLRGETWIESSAGVVNLTDAVVAGEDFALTWSKASGWHVSREWLVLAHPVDEAKLAPRPPANETVDLAQGRLLQMACGTGCRIVLIGIPDASTRIGIRGAADGPLVVSAATETHWAEFSEDDKRHAFAHHVPAGAVRAGGPSSKDATRLADATLDAHGRLGLLVIDARVDFSEAGRNGTIDTTARSERIHGAFGEARQVSSGFLYLELEGATFSPGAGTRAVALAPDATVRTVGRVELMATSGRLRVDATTHHLDGQQVTLQGDFILSPGPIHGPRLVEILDGVPMRRTTIAGDATDVWLSGVAIKATDPTAAAVVGLGGILLALWLALQRGALIGLYSRIVRSRVFENENRRRIWAHLQQFPGDHAASVARASGMARVVVQHHLGVLQVHGQVSSCQTGRIRRYYVVGQQEHPGTVHATLMDPNRQRIAAALVHGEGIWTQGRLAQHTGISARLVSYHLGILSEQGLVSVRGRWRRTYAASGLLADASAALFEEQKPTERAPTERSTRASRAASETVCTES